ncbi:MAG: DUF4340 domain-containing protein, partial [Bdellovibrionaceae bacterium]|nr:DUF4340 domain-containing protein [Pseudobdellovibrionaceae bacterium]
MKQARGTLILFLVVAVLGALTFWDFHSEEKKNKAELENTRIFPLDTEKIKSVSIRHGKDALKLSKDGQWRLETPVADAVDEPAVKDFLRDLTTERFQNVAREGEGIDWKIFGLDEPMATISVEESEGRKVSVLISAKKNFEGNSLIRIEGENRVLVAPFTLHSWATKKALDFRDRRILRADVSGVNEIIFSGKERLRLRLLEGQWRAEGRDVEIEASRVREFLNTLVNNKADEFALEGKATPAKRKELGLFRPVASIELGFSDRRWKADFFRGQDKINYAEVSDPAFILKVPAFLLTRFEEMDINAFRNLKKPFEFSRDSVQLVSWSKGGKKTTFK